MRKNESQMILDSIEHTYDKAKHNKVWDNAESKHSIPSTNQNTGKHTWDKA